MAKSDKFVQYLPDWKLIPPQKVLPKKILMRTNRVGFQALPYYFAHCTLIVTDCGYVYECVCVCVCVGMGASDFVNENSVGFSKLSLCVIYV